MNLRTWPVARGQTLVLFALTLLLLVVMVCMTLSMGAKVKERMELQTLADAAAYSSAVTTARAFNSVAVMNRVQVAHAVSTLGTLSLISWSTLYWKHADNAAELFRLMAVPYSVNTFFQCYPVRKPLCGLCTRALAQTLVLATLSTVHANQTRGKLRRDTELFTAETLPRWNAAQRIHAAQVEVLARARARVGDGPEGLAQAYLSRANLVAPDEVRVQPAGTAVTQRELNDAVLDHASARQGSEPHEVGHLVMGTRGHPFLRNRGEGSAWDRMFSSDSVGHRSLLLFAAGHVFYSGSRSGKGYYDSDYAPLPSGRPYEPRAHDGQGGRTRVAFLPAADVGRIPGAVARLRRWAMCMSPLPAFPIAGAIGLAGRGIGAGAVRVTATQHEGIGHTTRHAVETFPPFVDFNGAQVLDAANLQGQPKLVTALSRDPVPERDVWNLSFNFRTTAEDSRSLSLGGGHTFGGAPRQVAVGSGIVYYHRFQHSTEPPNLFAPYWRAGLTRLSIDRPRDGSPDRTLFDTEAGEFLSGTGATEVQGAFESLVRNGYTGW
ncbi:pilus assembly protein TadG-related protein [Myxococcus vastator]|uniref:pilus assembly protein TadG-related protein n=1 Tax=Myxococcus vastator TaxID=2709664 RepID=UPI0013D6DD14|nr:pilus assembly protein TadG-related protein [Myxococcus vastator]